jgi:hypothetical protein
MRFNLLPLVLLLLSLPVLAEKNDAIEITPLIGYRFGGDFDIEKPTQTIELTDGTNYGLLVAWPYDNKRQGELLISHYQSNFGEDSSNLFSNNDLGVTYLHLGGNIPIQDGALPLWLSAGLGLTYLSPQEKSLKDETKFSLNLGLNTRFNISENLSLRFGGRVYATFFNGSSTIFCDTDVCKIRITSDLWVQSEVNAGLTFSF